MDQEAARVAASALHRGLAGELGDPIPISSPDGALEGWFIPATRGGNLLGFHQLRRDLRPLRWSEFASPVDARLWMDPETIRLAAAAELQYGEVASAPVLTYDGSPDRLAWAVPLTGPAGKRGRIFVAGTAVWRPSR